MEWPNECMHLTVQQRRIVPLLPGKRWSALAFTGP